MKRNFACLSGAAMLAATAYGTPARAADCWVETVAPAKTGNGEAVSNPRFARLVAAMDRAETMLRQDPTLNAIPGVRFQVRRHVTYIDNERPSYTASVLLLAHEESVWGKSGCTVQQGKANYHNRYGIEIAFNQVEDILNEASANEEGHVANLDLETVGTFRRTGLIAGVGQGIKGFRADGGVILVPYSVATHLSVWEQRLTTISAEGGGSFADPQLAALRRHRAGLTARQLEAQVAIDANPSENLWGYTTQKGQVALPVFAVAPELLVAAKDKAAVRLVTVKWFGTEDNPSMSARLRQWAEQFSSTQAQKLIGEK